jgi:hypothetical protein
MQAGYVLHEETVSDNWGNNELSLDCYHERTSDHKIRDITVMNDTFNSFVWENYGRTFSLSLNENILTYKQGSYHYWDVRPITKDQLEDFQMKKSQYPLCP